MSAETVTPLRPTETAWSGDVGEFEVEVHRHKDGGTLCLRPREGAELRIELRGDVLSLNYAGPEVRLTAPDARLTLDAEDIELKARKTLSMDAGEEVDIHSGVDVEVRADHHVNLWGHGVLVGD
jgi:hypothetical protein